MNLDNKIDSTFIIHASEVLGDTNTGLSGEQIVKYCNAYALQFNVQTPINDSNFGKFGSKVPNKRTALQLNLQAFNILFQDKNPHEFLFKELLVRARTENYKEVIQILESEMKFIEKEKIKFELEIKKITLFALGNYSNDLGETFKIWQERTLILDNRIKLWLKKYEYKTERNFLLDLTSKIKGFNYENWSSINDIHDYKDKIEKLTKEVKEKEKSESNVVEIVTGDEKILVPCIKEHSQMGKMLKTKLQSVIKAMGLSIKDDEKKLILLEILKEL